VGRLKFDFHTGRTHKVVSEAQRACFKAHKDKLREKFRMHPGHLLERAELLGEMWVDTLRNVTDQAGRRPLVIYYEALQTAPKKEMRRLFAFAGLHPSTKIRVESSSKKLTPEDLRITHRAVLLDGAATTHGSIRTGSTTSGRPAGSCTSGGRACMSSSRTRATGSSRRCTCPATGRRPSRTSKRRSNRFKVCCARVAVGEAHYYPLTFPPKRNRRPPLNATSTSKS